MTICVYNHICCFEKEFCNNVDFVMFIETSRYHHPLLNLLHHLYERQTKDRALAKLVQFCHPFKGRTAR